MNKEALPHEEGPFGPSLFGLRLSIQFSPSFFGKGLFPSPLRASFIGKGNFPMGKAPEGPRPPERGKECQAERSQKAQSPKQWAFWAFLSSSGQNEKAFGALLGPPSPMASGRKEEKEKGFLVFKEAF